MILPSNHHTRDMTTECFARNTWTDSGDRGAARHEHVRRYHPDHFHVWGPSSYEWEQKGRPHIAEGDGINVTPRPETVTRCQVCTIAPSEDFDGLCSPAVLM